MGYHNETFWIQQAGAASHSAWLFMNALEKQL